MFVNKSGKNRVLWEKSPILIIMGRYWPPENRRNYSELGFIYL
jgi:hypothetical protein